MFFVNCPGKMPAREPPSRPGPAELPFVAGAAATHASTTRFKERAAFRIDVCVFLPKAIRNTCGS